jgi:MFS superfamily sulfate permease-like transporter
VWRASQSELSVLGREPGRFILSDSRRHPENRTIPGLLIVRPDEGLFFANADALHSEIITLVESAKPPARVVLLDLEMSNQLDVPSMDMLAELNKELEHRQAELWLARLHLPVRQALERSGFLQQVGPEKVHPRSLDSILEYLERLTPQEVDDIALVDDGLQMTLEVIDRLLILANDSQRQVLEGYNQKLAEISQQLKE